MTSSRLTPEDVEKLIRLATEWKIAAVAYSVASEDAKFRTNYGANRAESAFRRAVMKLRGQGNCRTTTTELGVST